jgi:hypothetical protein
MIVIRWIYRFFARAQWARKKMGGKWERVGSQWERVQEWSSPRSRPDLYGTGSIPEREEWNG